MKYREVRIFGCVVCGRAHITESREAMTPDHMPAENFNCDLNTYSNAQIGGGVLFKNRPALAWAHNAALAWGNTPHAGICAECYWGDAVQRMLPYIKDDLEGKPATLPGKSAEMMAF